jgi:uncharacterized BrkB/YihY/UPF0761 family membrane protein
LGGENVIGAIVFVISFVLFLLVSFVISLPPGLWIVEEYIPDIMQTDYESLAIGIINGVIYGVIIWVIFSLVMMVYDRMRGEPKIAVEVKTKE